MSLPRVLAPVEVVGSVDGISVAVLFVELWADEVRVVLAAVPGGETDRRDAEYRAAFGAWAQRRRSGEDAEPPAEPGLLGLLGETGGLDVTDDVGTQYVWTAATDADGWHGAVTLRPAPPREARNLVVRAAAHGRALGAVKVDLDDGPGAWLPEPTQGPLARVLSPGTVLGAVDGIPILLAGVELWFGRTIVTLLAPRTPADWCAEPAHALHLTDDRGTVYRWAAGSAHGAAGGWRRELTSTRAVPMGVRELTFRLVDGARRSDPFRLALPPA